MRSLPRPPPAPLGVEIRPCRQRDLALLEWHGAHSEHREIIDQTFARPRAGEALMLLAVRARFPVAQVWLDFLRPARTDTALLWALRTYPPVRRRGIGTCLVRHAERSVAERGHTAVELGVEKRNPGALRFYERLGYARVGELVETCRYRSPDGEERQWIVDQWQLRQELTRPDARSANAGSGSAGPWATSRHGASRR